MSRSSCEAGPADTAVILLLHGFPAAFSCHSFPVKMGHGRRTVCCIRDLDLNAVEFNEVLAA